MTIDKEKLKDLAEAVGSAGNHWGCRDHAERALSAELSADTVLALLAEIEQLRDSYEQVCANYNRVSFASEERGEQIDQLKAENEALRNSLGYCAASLEGEMLQKFGGQKPEDMHPVTRREYDRDMAELAGYRAAMAKEASHG